MQHEEAVEKLAALAAATMISLLHSGAALRRCCAMLIFGTSDGPNEGGTCRITFLSILWPSYFAGLPRVSVSMCVDAAYTGVLGNVCSFRQFVQSILLFAGCCRMLPSTCHRSSSCSQPGTALRTCTTVLHRSAMWVWLLMLCDAADHIQ